MHSDSGRSPRLRNTLQLQSLALTCTSRLTAVLKASVPSVIICRAALPSFFRVTRPGGGGQWARLAAAGLTSVEIRDVARLDLFLRSDCS